MKQAGFSLLEILIGAGILTASFLGVLTVFDRLTRASDQMVALTQAGFLLEEGLEAARIWRDNAWVNIGDWPPETDYYLVWSGNTWATTTLDALIDGKFRRSITVRPVERDSSTDDIVTVGGTDDPNTKLVTATVAWSSGLGATTTKTLSAYLSNIFE